MNRLRQIFFNSLIEPFQAEPAMMAMQPKPMTDTPASLKNLVEPLPASALMGLIKVEQQAQHQLPTAPVPVSQTSIF